MKKVAILLVLYNDAHHLPRLIHSIKDQNYQDFDIYAIETSSSGQSMAKLLELYPKAIAFPHQGNLGFAAGNNYLAKNAEKDGADFIFVLNTDMDLEKNCLTELVRLVERYPQIGGAAPIVLHGRGVVRTDEIQCYAEKINFNTAVTVPLIDQNKINENLPEKMEVNIIHGGASFINAELYRKIGLFNEDNFMYGDERDLAYRMNQTNYKFYVTRKAICWHFHERSVDNKLGFRREYFYRLRNRYLYFLNYKKYRALFFELFKEIIKVPFVIRWAYKRKDISLLKYYYLGIAQGLIRQKGKTKYNFGEK